MDKYPPIQEDFFAEPKASFCLIFLELQTRCGEGFSHARGLTIKLRDP